MTAFWLASAASLALVALFLAGLLHAAGRAARAEEAEYERTRREASE